MSIYTLGCIEFIESNTLFPVFVIKQQTLDCRCTIGKQFAAFIFKGGGGMGA